MGFSRRAPGTAALQASPSAAAPPPGSEPRLKASMYFAYNGEARPGWEWRTTFEAILAGARTSTTRFPAWGGVARWQQLRAGDTVRFFEDKEMRGRFVDVIIDSVTPIDLRACSADELEAWSEVEGWSPLHGRKTGQRYGAGVQVRYHLPR